MTLMNIRTLQIVALTLLSGTLPASAQLLNPDFELPSIASETHQAMSAADWAGGIYIFNGAGGVPLSFPPPDSGAQYVDIGSGPSGLLSQTVVIDHPSVLNLSWSGASGLGIGTGMALYKARIIGVGQLVPEQEGSYDGGHHGVWQHESLPSVTVSAGSYRVQFEGFNGNGDSLIDNVNLNVTPVPEPDQLAAWTSLGLVGWVAWRKRRFLTRATARVAKCE